MTSRFFRDMDVITEADTDDLPDECPILDITTMPGKKVGVARNLTWVDEGTVRGEITVLAECRNYGFDIALNMPEYGGAVIITSNF